MPTPPNHGTVSISGKVVTYTPVAGYYGSDSYTYTATSSGGTSLPATVNVTVATPPAPTVSAKSVAIPFNSPGTAIDLAPNIGGVATTLAVASGPSRGSVSTSGRIVTYTPTAGYIGSDSFTYTATGPGGTSAPATVTLNVETPAAPTVASPSVAVPYNSPGTAINLAPGITGIATSIAVTAHPAHGAVSVSGQVVTYTPAAGYQGPDRFTYTATGPGGTSATGTVTLTIAPPSATTAAVTTTGAVTVRVTSEGRSGSFAFTSSLPDANAFTLTTPGATSKVFGTVQPGSYEVAQGQVVDGFKLASLTCSGATVAGTTVQIRVVAGSAAVCTFAYVFDQESARKQTQATIRNFMNSRANALVSSQPDVQRRHDRMSGSLLGDEDEQQPPPVSGPGAGAPPLRPATGMPGALDRTARQNLGAGSQPVSVTGNLEDGTGRVSMLTSLSQIARSMGENDASRMSLGGTAPRSAATNQTRPPIFDMWLEAHASRFEDNTGNARRRGNLDLLYLGADVLAHKALLIGAQVQFDRAKETSSVLGTSAEGTGWMAGPYVSARLTRNVYFDARAAWGRSNNTVAPYGTYEDKFAAYRALYSAKLSGNWYAGQWRLSPSLEVTSYSETQQAFTSKAGVAIPEQTASLGRLTAGQEFGYRFVMPDRSLLEPYVGLKALWDFQKDTTVSIGGMDIGTTTLRGKLEAGMRYSTPSGISIVGAVGHDGIGDRNYKAYDGRVQVNIPFR